VVVGTKCNKLLLLNTRTYALREVAPPPAPPRQPRSSEAPVEGQAYGNCGIHAVALSPDAQLLATGGASPNDCQVYRVRGGAQRSGAPALAPAQTLVVRALLHHHVVRGLPSALLTAPCCSIQAVPRYGCRTGPRRLGVRRRVDHRAPPRHR
jgi:hypothetical protein